MNRVLQQSLLALYRAVDRTGLLSTRPARRLFYHAYDFYKLRLEAGDIRLLRPLVRPGSSVLDVGANVGLFTLQFARWVSDGGRVYAFEPEPENFRRLVERLAEAGLENRVEAMRAAVAEVEGDLRLSLSEVHPADHRLGESGIPVPAVTIDGFVERTGREISLIKIDVQGAELRVLAGARRTLTRQRPALHLEVEEENLAAFAATAEELIRAVTVHGYQIRRLLRRRISEPLTLDEALRHHAREGGVDLLFLPA